MQILKEDGDSQSQGFLGKAGKWEQTAFLDEENTEFNLMTELKIDLSYSKQVIMGDDVSLTMKECGTLNDHTMTEDTYHLIYESSVIKMSEDRHNEIIKAMYSNINIKEHVQTLYLT